MERFVGFPEEPSPKAKIEFLKQSEIAQFIVVAREAIRDEILPKEREKSKKQSIKERSMGYYEKALAKPHEWTLLRAKDPEGKIVGILEAEIIVIDGEKVGLVNLVGVSENKKRQGIATDLYRAYELILKERKDVSLLMAGIYDTNIPSLELHKKLGITKIFREMEDGRAKVYYKTLG
jgi:ribosomal protein S18 acetylase RimI-like enzyme